MIVTLTAAVLSAAIAKVEAIAPAAPLASMNRLARLHGPSAPGDGPERAAGRARLEALVQYVSRIHVRMSDGSFRNDEWFNMLQVERDMADAGSAVSALPEEVLCWRRVGLDLALSHERFAAVRGVPSQLRDQARAQVEFMRAQYATALARCAQR
ncbi:MAG TPA: hypothetical protein VD866_27455 [Urbifossiella sp.]|nr:hypothetical protein [Urbifossiella sp.]